MDEIITKSSNLLNKIENGEKFLYHEDSSFNWQWERDKEKLFNILTKKSSESKHDGLIWTEDYLFSDTEIDLINDKIIKINKQEKASQWLAEQPENIKNIVKILIQMSAVQG